MTVSAIILAGGKSSRMGRDKALVPLAGQAMIVWTAAAMSRIPGCVEIIIAGGNVSRGETYSRLLKGHVPVPVRPVADQNEDAGPIAGLIAAARVANGEIVALAPVDSPLLLPELYVLLLEEMGTQAGAVAEIGDRPEPLNAVYRTARLLAATADGAVEAPRDLVELLDVALVHEARVKEVDEELLTFADADTPEELAELEDLIAARGGGATRAGKHGLVDQAR
ncbi:MAG: molybdenum cofactor guanylyltransferase [Euryarchaeota archaeon]|nr:molybdenum cofactor guanylyltransferase [Euryarchaeota archaeon]